MDEKLKVYEEKMKKTMNNLGGELGAIRAGRANPHVLDRIVVDYYGEKYAQGDRESNPGI